MLLGYVRLVYIKVRNLEKYVQGAGKNCEIRFSPYKETTVMIRLPDIVVVNFKKN